MNMENRTKKWQELKELSDEQIRENLAKKIWNPETEEIAERELHAREQHKTLEKLANSAEASERAAVASDKTANATRRLVKATWFLVFATFGIICISAYTGAILPFCEKRFTIDAYMKELKQTLPSIRAEMLQNIRMIDRNRELLAKNVQILNGLFVLEKPEMNEVTKYIWDANVVFSISSLRGCLDMLNQKIDERNTIYNQLLTNGDPPMISKVIIPKEKAIKTTAEGCLGRFDDAQKGLDNIHTYRVSTTTD